MRIVIFCHSLISDWNHGNAHFLRGISAELLARGHTVDVYEPTNAWSLRNLVTERGEQELARFTSVYPMLRSHRYDPATLDLDSVLGGAHLVLVHEWNDHSLVERIGAHHRSNGGYRLLFHDTHHRSVTDPQSMAAYRLQYYDGVLAFGEVVRDLYLSRGWAARAWTWHEAADTRVFHPCREDGRDGDLIWIGNWGDDERTQELDEFLLEPVRRLRLRARVHGVRYPEHAQLRLRRSGIDYAGWIANYDAPRAYARFGVTVHVPRRPYVEALPGVPTIRVFEALACGIPLVCAPWTDAESLFTPGKDFLLARTGEDMMRHLKALLGDPAFARELSEHGKRTILRRHTCAHRVDELLSIYAGLKPTEALEVVA